MAQIIEWNGHVYTIPKLADRIGITPAAMRYRLKNWEREDAITLPADARPKSTKARKAKRQKPVSARSEPSKSAAKPAWMQKLEV